MKTPWLLALFLIPFEPQDSPAPALAFDFGTPTSPTRPGFRKVTHKEFGDISQDRGGWQRGKDGRTATDATCDFVEGLKSATFEFSAPNGAYTGWIVVFDRIHDPPHFEVWTHGEKRLDVRIPRRGFVFLESFPVEVKDGRGRIDFRGKHGFLVNAIVIGKEREKTVSALERDIFTFPAEDRALWKELRRTPVHPEPAADARGYVPFVRDYSVKVYPDTCPAASEIGRPMLSFATPGEIEPASCAIRAQKDLGTVSVAWSDFRCGELTLPAGTIEAGVVRCLPQRKRGTWGTSGGHYRIEPEFIEPAGKRPLLKGTTRQWWFTVRVPADAKPGVYEATVTLNPQSAEAVRIPWRLRVLPFSLDRAEGLYWGTWLATGPPYVRPAGPARRGRNTPEEKRRLALAEMADYRDHGFNVPILEASYNVRAREKNGAFHYTLGALPERIASAGNVSVVPVGLEYFCRRWETAPGKFDARGRRAIVGLIRFLESERKRLKWPPLLHMPIDEPGNSKTRNRMEFARQVLGMVKEVKGARTACTLTAKDYLQLKKWVDIPVFAMGHFDPKTAPKPFWFYSNGMFYAESTIASRARAGFDLIRTGAECATAWGFASYTGNPHNDFDGTHEDWSVVVPGGSTIYWELCREGVDDARYVATLRNAIARAPVEKRNPAEEALRSIVDPDAPPITDASALHRFRWRIAMQILLLRDGGPNPFSDVPQAHAPRATWGENLLSNPSFESKPTQIGLPPGRAYAAAVRNRPGPLSVSTENARTGKQSLKWELRKAADAGSIYGGKRYLTVNLPVPAKGLAGRRVRIGMWVRIAGGLVQPADFRLRCWGKGRTGKQEYVGGVAARTGIEDVTVWNHLVSEGTVPQTATRMDLHLPVIVPNEASVRDAAVFYVDDLSVQKEIRPPVDLRTPLEDVFTGEPIRWSARTELEGLEIRLMKGGKSLAQSTVPEGRFLTDGLEPGVYVLEASAGGHRASYRVWLGHTPASTFGNR